MSALCGQVSLVSMGTPPPIELANLGMADSLILMVLALVVFGPRRLPQIGRQIGKLMYEFRKASNDFKFQMEEELRNAEDADRRKKEEDRLAALALAAPAPPALALEATVPAATSVMESHYPDETQYPELTALETTAENSPEETVPRIQPPSTGEQVPAAKPTSPAVQLHAADESGAEVSDETSLDSNLVAEVAPPAGGDAAPSDEVNPDPSPDLEQAAHHG